MANEHTSAPWHIEYPYGEPGPYISAADTALIARLVGYVNADGNARHIVRAVNAHDELVEALLRLDRGGRIGNCNCQNVQAVAGNNEVVCDACFARGAIAKATP